MTFHPCYLSTWLQTEPGALLVAMESAQLKRVLNSIHGNYLVQIGGLPELCATSSIRFKWFFNTQAKPGTIQVALDELPLVPHSVDAIILIHVLEFTPKPPVLLQEVYQALAPGGQLIIINLNPWSLWGLKHGLSHDRDLPWNGHFWSMWQVKHWLRGIGFRIVTADTFCFRPPTKKAKWWRRLLWMEALGSFCFPMLGGFFLMTAQKRIEGMILKPDLVRKEKLAINGKLEPTTLGIHQEFPLKGTFPCAMGDRKGGNRDSSPSFRAIGFADAQDLNQEAILAVLSGNSWNISCRKS